ncbi:acid protease [Ophiobolus disseminans]|uniref:Acid protease n=1 Tax=Ophiobolus disseminans TaxID=1469910 RepID=A0A6A7A5S6_9PLEO|nr:acid protease [Ophiobolus disseminans]
MSNSTVPRKPAPLSFAASQWFEGPDGQWSSFVVRAGTPEQSFRVLPSTVTSETFLPLNSACKEGSPTGCPFSRGVETYNGKPGDGFQPKNSGTWHEIGIYRVAAREELRYDASGLYGLESLGLMIANSGGPTLQSQVVAGVVNPKFWVGRLGMDVKPSNFSEFDNPQRSLIKTLKEENHIPSLSYGYTAGAYYKRPQAFGSLIYGGYDKTRLVMNNISFPFDTNDSRKPSLDIRSIVSQDSTNRTVNLLPEGTVYSLIDFAEAQMWLPVSACDAFAKAFNLTYDSSTDLYLVDPGTRSRLLQQNPSITFGLGPTANPAERLNIVLPYSAFDQQATYPIYPNATRYFPIRRADNDTMYTIGRTFFQEAYVIIDYDRGNFSVHQALFPATTEKQDIVAILSPEPNDAVMRIANHGPSWLTKGAIVGISIGGGTILVFLALLSLWLLRRHIVAKREAAAASRKIKWHIEIADQPTIETGGSAFYEKDGRQVVEMEGHPLPELQTAYGQSMNRDSGTNLSVIIEYYEMADSNSLYAEEEHYVVPLKNRPPPGWI